VAVIRLTLDIDSAVHPELHAMLSEVGSDASREERMRALAASGLAWERFRMLSQAAPVAQATPAIWVAPAAAVPAVASTIEVSEVEAPVTVDDAQDKIAAAEDRLRDFVDLAINAEPEPVPLSLAASVESMVAPRPSQPNDFDADMASIARELPVLLDVVEVEAPSWASPVPRSVISALEADDDSAGGSDVEPQLAASPIPPAPMPIPTPSVVELRPAQATSTANDDDLITVTVVPRKAPSRERVMRMKERGLFKNG
jgi:hypothetical protein